MVLHFTPAAERDIDRIAAFIARDSPDSAARFLPSVRATAESLLDFSQRGRTRPFRRSALSRTRSLAVRGFPRHLIFYRAAGDILRVVRVLPGVIDLDQIFGP